MKKIISLLLAAVLFVSAFAFASCEKQTAYTLVSGALKKTGGLDSIEANFTMNRKETFEGEETVDYRMAYTMKAVNLNTDSIMAVATMTVKMMGEPESEGDLYMDHEYYYLSTPDEQAKMKIDKMGEETKVLDWIGLLTQPLPEALLSDAVIEKGQDGTKTVSLEISAEDFETLLDDLYENFLIAFVSGAETKELSLSNIKIDIAVNEDGYISTYALSFDYEIEVVIFGYAMKSSNSTEIAATYINPGAAVTVQLPDGYQDFTEIDPDNL